MKTFLNFLFSHAVMAILMIFLAVVMGLATFYENDYGTITSKAVIYNTWWFELLWGLLTINLIGSTFKNRLYTKEKFSILIFHLAFVIMIIGAAITRYTSLEGTMRIREGEVQNQMLSTANYFEIKSIVNGDTMTESSEVFLSNNAYPTYVKSFKHGEHEIKVEIIDFMTSSMEALVDDTSENAQTYIHILAGDPKNGIHNYFATPGEDFKHGEKTFGFNTSKVTDVNIKFIDDSIYLKMPVEFLALDIWKNKIDTIEADSNLKLKQDVVYQIGESQFMVKNLKAKSKIQLIQVDDHQTLDAKDAVKILLKVDGKEQESIVYGESGTIGVPTILEIGGVQLHLSYGAKLFTLPFSLKLNDFILDRYKGSMSPSSYKSEVELIDKEENIREKHSIFMNNILNHRGYRFFQSSYDEDELGTALSVNYDSVGTTVSYIGYFLMALGIVLALFTRKSRFRDLIKSLSAKTYLIITLLLSSLISINLQAQEVDQQIIKDKQVVDAAYANEFGKLIIVDMKGRMKPVHTLAFEIVRKVTKQSNYANLSPTQLFIGMSSNPEYWQNIPLIRVGHDELKKILSKTADYVSYKDVIDPNAHNEAMAYKIKPYVEAANSKPPKNRSKFDKEVIKFDERLNICMMIYSGSMLNIYPVMQGEKWVSVSDLMSIEQSAENMNLLQVSMKQMGTFAEAMKSGKWEKATASLHELQNYQRRIAGKDMPSTNQISIEILYNKFNIFSKLAKLYAVLGGLLIVLLFYSIFKIGFNPKKVLTIGKYLIITAFVLHTLGLILRWYLSGHAPMSNGYETLLFISWTAVLGGLLFAGKSPLTLAASNILGALSLTVAGMSWMDPELTNLVPVLKSYWLVIHVTIITSSYGFFAIAAIGGLINVIIASLQTRENAIRLRSTINEMAYVIEIMVIIGLYLLTIGTFLGGVWANESWGRYWGWDPKETWALISIFVYSIVFHMRKIPGMKGSMHISIASLLAFGSILMTYFGVNYFLSGMHSYGAGESFTIPVYVYLTIYGIIALILLAIYGEVRSKNYLKNLKEES